MSGARVVCQKLGCASNFSAMKNQLWPFLFGALFCVLPMASAQNDPVSAAPAAPTPPFTPAPLFSARDISVKTLPSGVQSIVKTAPGFDLVSVQIWVKAGSRTERSDESGAAFVIETAAKTASKTFPASSTSDEGGFVGAIKTVGGDAGAFTSRDATFYSATVAAPHFTRALGALADAVLRPDLSDNALEDAKASASDEIIGRGFDAVALASDLAYQNAFSKHPYRRAAQGSTESLDALSPAKIRGFYNRQYVGKNIGVVVCGRVSPADAHAAVARAFATASAKAAVEVPVVADPFGGPKEVTRRTLVLRDALTLAWRSPGIDKPDDVVALDAILALWREGLDANLRKVLLRDGEDGPNKPLVEAFDVDFLTQRDPGLFMVSLSGVSDRDGALEAVQNEVKRLRESPISDAELLRARTQLRNQYLEQSENAAGQAGALGFYYAISTHQFAVEYLSRCARVSKADIQRVARTYFGDDKRVQIEVVPLPRPNAPREDDLTPRNPTLTISF